MRLFRIAALSSVLVAFAALAAQEMGHGIDLAGIDHSVAPGDDFYKYANGAWIKTAVIPPDRAVEGPGAVLIDKTRERVRGLGGEFRIYDAKPGTAVEVALPIAQATPVSNAVQK